MRSTLLLLAALAMLAAALAGCGGTGGSGDNRDGTRTQAVKFAECMRAKGVGTFPDPSASGELTIDAVANGTSVDVNGAAWKHAIAACKDLEPPGFTGSKVTPEQRAARLEFARCIRGDGVPDFPDPAPNGPLVDTGRIPSAATPAGMSALNAAMHKCGAVYATQLGLTGR